MSENAQPQNSKNPSVTREKIGYKFAWDVPAQIPRQFGKRKLWLTADEHYRHKNIIAYQNRPFSDLSEMDETLITNHNSVVNDDDVVIHIGDFCFGKGGDFARFAKRLTGTHFFMDGSHDHCLRDFFSCPEEFGGTEGKLFLLPKLFEFTFGGKKVVLCHYSLRTWWASHYDSYHFFGHSHGRLPNLGRSRDVGVETNNYFPIEIEAAMKSVEPEVSSHTLTDSPAGNSLDANAQNTERAESSPHEPPR